MLLDIYKDDTTFCPNISSDFDPKSTSPNEFIPLFHHFQQISLHDLSELNQMLDEISKISEASKGKIMKHSIVTETDLINHFIFLLSELNVPLDIKLKVIYSLGWCLLYFTEEQIHDFISRPMIRPLFATLQNLLPSEPTFFSNELCCFFFFLSQLSKTTKEARDTVIWNFPLIQDTQYEDFESKVNDFFRYLIEFIKLSVDENSLQVLTTFFKSCCRFALNPDISLFICHETMSFLNKPKIFWSNFLDVDLSLCMNGHVQPVSFIILKSGKLSRAFRKGDLETLNKASKILQYFVDNDISLTEDEFLFETLSQKLTKTLSKPEKSIIILNTIESILKRESEMSDIYFRKFLRRRVIQKVNQLISDENLSTSQKVSSLKLLQIFSQKQESLITKELIKEKCIVFADDLFDLSDSFIDIMILQFFMDVFNASQNDDGMLLSILTQIIETNLDSRLTDLIHNENTEVAQLAQVLQKKIDELKEREEGLTEIDQFLDSDNSIKISSSDEEEGQIVSEILNAIQQNESDIEKVESPCEFNEEDESEW